MRRWFHARLDELLFRAGTGAFALLLIVIVGAIGVSGGTSQQDGQCARAGADALT